MFHGPGFGSPSPFPLRRGSSSQPSSLPQVHAGHTADGSENVGDKGKEIVEEAKQKGEPSVDKQEAQKDQPKKRRKTSTKTGDKEKPEQAEDTAKEGQPAIPAADMEKPASQAADKMKIKGDGQAGQLKAAKARAAKSKPGKEDAKKQEPAQATKKDVADKKQPPKIDIWWDDEQGKAFLRVSGKSENKLEMSKELVGGEDGFVYAIFEGFEKWRVPHLLPDDLDKFKAGQPLPKGSAAAKPAKTPAAKRKPAKDKPVQDFELKDIVRCRYATQGEKNPPIIKVELRQDRFDTSSKWAQKFQIVIKDNITATYAMNVATTFAEAYVYMNLNQGMLNFKECRNALIEYTADGFDWNKQRLNWKVIDALCWRKIFPPACLGNFCSAWVIVMASRVLASNRSFSNDFSTPLPEARICPRHGRAGRGRRR